MLTPIKTDVSEPTMHLRNKGSLSLSEVADLLLKGDEDCIDSLLLTIRNTMAATHLRLHVQSVRHLAGLCVIINDLLEKDFYRGDEVFQAFKLLNEYAAEGIPPRLH